MDGSEGSTRMVVRNANRVQHALVFNMVGVGPLGAIVTVATHVADVCVLLAVGFAILYGGGVQVGVCYCLLVSVTVKLNFVSF